MWICGSGASVQALSSGHWRNSSRLATCEQGARRGHGTSRWTRRRCTGRRGTGSVSDCLKFSDPRGVEQADRLSMLLLAAHILPLQSAAHASEQFVRSERFYEIANRVGFDCLRLRPLVRIGSHENGGDRTIQGDQMLM